MIKPSLSNLHLQLLTGNHCSSILHAVKHPQSSHHGNHSREVSCYSDGKWLGVLSATAFCVYLCVCCMQTGDEADS